MSMRMETGPPRLSQSLRRAFSPAPRRAFFYSIAFPDAPVVVGLIENGDEAGGGRVGDQEAVEVQTYPAWGCGVLRTQRSDLFCRMGVAD